MSTARILLGVGGGIAAYKAPLLVRALKTRGHEVRCAVTRSAEAFIAPLTLEVLSGEPVYRQEYLSPNDSGEELHVTAAEWADVLAIYPATAHLVARLALGLADDFLTTTALVFRGPLVLAPAMHSAMWEHEATRRNVELLAARGARFAGPVEGPLASGEIGIGRLVDPEQAAAAITAALEALPAGRLAGRRVVVSAGPTFEDIDPVRFIGNRSSGKMGFALAAAAAAEGAEVVLVAGPVERPTPRGVRRVDVRSARQLLAVMRAEAPAADAVIMTAAVADYRPARPARSKIKKSAGGPPEIELVENPDVLTELAELAPHALRVGFAAETGDPEAEARAKLERKRAHWIVANDVSGAGIGFAADDNEVRVFRRDAEPVFFSRRSKQRLAAGLIALVAAELDARPSDRAPQTHDERHPILS